MFNLDEEKIECALGNKEFGFWLGKKIENVVFLILASGFIYLSRLIIFIINFRRCNERRILYKKVFNFGTHCGRYCSYNVKTGCWYT